MALCDFDKIIKDSVNPMYKRTDGKPNYATLSVVHDSVKPELQRYGMYYSAFESIENSGYLCVRITHAESNTYIETFVKLLNMSDMQKYVGSKTYARKSGISDLCGLYAEDDDGNIASTPNKSVDEIKTAFKPIELPIEQVKKIKEDLLILWDLKKESAVDSFPAKADFLEQILANNFMKTTKEGELLPIETIELLRIQKWLKGI